MLDTIFMGLILYLRNSGQQLHTSYLRCAVDFSLRHSNIVHCIPAQLPACTVSVLLPVMCTWIMRPVLYLMPKSDVSCRVAVQHFIYTVWPSYIRGQTYHKVITLAYAVLRRAEIIHLASDELYNRKAQQLRAFVHLNQLCSLDMNVYERESVYNIGGRRTPRRIRAAGND